MTLLEGQQKGFVQAGLLWVGESVDELALEHFCTHLGCNGGGKFGHCLLECSFKTPSVGVDSLSDVVVCRLKLNGACCSRLNGIELCYKVCAKVGPRVALVRMKPTIQKAGLTAKVLGQSLDALVFIPTVGVRAHHVAIEPLDYVTGADGGWDGVRGRVYMLDSVGLCWLISHCELVKLCPQGGYLGLELRDCGTVSFLSSCGCLQYWLGLGVCLSLSVLHGEGPPDPSKPTEGLAPKGPS